MTTAFERQQWRALLEICPLEQLQKIAASIYSITTVRQGNKAGLIDGIVRSTTSSEDLLRRKYITSQVLWYYCRSVNLETPNQNTKRQLAQTILHFWSLDHIPPAMTSRLKGYEGEECTKILRLLDRQDVTKYWSDLYPGRSSVPSEFRMCNEILYRIPEVRWLLNKKRVTADVLKEYLRREGRYTWDNPSKPVLIERVLAHISAHRPAQLLL